MAKVVASLVLLSSTTEAFVARPTFNNIIPPSNSVLKMSEIEVVSQPDKDFLNKKGVFSWSKWGCGVSCFPWTYDQNESCFLLAGKVTVTPDDKTLKPATFGKGDFVTFPAGMSCTWDVSETVEKHFMFF